MPSYHYLVSIYCYDGIIEQAFSSDLWVEGNQFDIIVAECFGKAAAECCIGNGAPVMLEYVINSPEFENQMMRAGFFPLQHTATFQLTTIPRMIGPVSHDYPRSQYPTAVKNKEMRNNLARIFRTARKALSKLLKK